MKFYRILLTDKIFTLSVIFLLFINFSFTQSVQDRLNGSETPYDIYLSNNSLLDSLYGKSYQGGIIAYLNTATGDGFVATFSDLTSIAEWGCNGYNISGADGTAIGDGIQNTTDIVLGCSTNNIAAKLCMDLSQNSYNDWFLPSKNEVFQLYYNLHLKGLGNFKLINAFYWSSSEVNSSYAWAKDFGTGNNINFGRNIQITVRPIREYHQSTNIDSYQNEIIESIFPNPTNDNITLKFNQPTTAQISIYNLSGQQVLVAQIYNTNIYKIAISTFPNGLYIIKIKTENSIFTNKLIKN